MEGPWSDYGPELVAGPWTDYAAAKPAPPPSKAFTQGRASAKKGILGGLTGAVTTMEEAIPFADEAQAAISSVGRMAQGEKPAEAWRNSRDYQRGLMTGFKEEHPALANVATSAGWSADAVPILLSGGAAAPEVLASAGTRTLAQRGARMAMTGAKNATVGATLASGSAMAGRGAMTERLRDAGAAAGPGAIVGMAAPIAADAGGFVARKVGGAVAATARAAARTANSMASKTPAGPFLDPQSQVLDRLVEAMQKDGLTGPQIGEALDEWNRVGGATPAFMDIVAKHGGGQNTMSLIRGAAVSGAGKNEASKYGSRVAADLQDVVIDRTHQLTPNQPSAPSILAGVEDRIARSSAIPDTTSGAAGADVHRTLNASYDQAKAAVDQAYGAARAAAPQAAHLRSAEMPRIAAAVRESVRDYHPDTVPGVTTILNGLDRLSTPTVRDLFEARQQLSSLRGGLDRVQSGAAARASRALDTEIQDAADRGLITGEPAAVQTWRDAIAMRRDFGRQFEGDDLIAQLTERGNHGGARGTVVASEDASNAILGRNGVSQRPDLVRDLARLRDTLGADSPQWNQLRQEAMHRVLGKDAGTVDFGRAWDRFESQSPDLAHLLMTPADRAALSGARGRITGAVRDRTAVETGRGVLNTPSSEYAVSMTGLNGRRPLAQVGATHEMTARIEAPTGNATGTLNRIASSTRAKNNLAATFDPQPAADYQTSVGNAVEQVQNARYINPNMGSKTAGLLADERLVESIPTSKLDLVKAIIDKFRAGATLTDQERGELVRLATSRADETAPRVTARMAKHIPLPRLMTGQPMRALALPMTDQENRR